jgi:fructose-bisphosphate aldolase class II
MALVTLKDLLSTAEKQKIAVGAFSVGNMEMVLGAIKAAEKNKHPDYYPDCRSKITYIST